ncbi:MAG: transglycosylase SLT domain-containing protein [Chloroflexota bacterium]
MPDPAIDRIARGLAAASGRRRVLAALFALAAGAGAAPGPAAAKCRTLSQRKVERYIKAAARKYRQPYRKLLCVAMCESSLDNCAVNVAGKSYGLFQFIDSTWSDPYLNPSYHRKSYWHPKWASLATAEMWSRGLSTHWDCCCPHWGCSCPGQDPPWCRR